MQEIGKYIIFAGLDILVIGILLYFFGNKFSWFGNLPGDIRVEKENFRFYMPITSMILVSVAISAMIWIVKKLFN